MPRSRHPDPAAPQTVTEFLSMFNKLKAKNLNFKLNATKSLISERQLVDMYEFFIRGQMSRKVE